MSGKIDLGLYGGYFIVRFLDDNGKTLDQYEVTVDNFNISLNAFHFIADHISDLSEDCEGLDL